MTSTRTPRELIYYGIVALLSALAFLVFLFTIGGGRPSGPGLFLAVSVMALGVVAHLLYRAARSLTEPDDEPSAGERATGVRRKELEREYQALKRALKELELDHAMGKLSDSDYVEIRVRYRERAVRVLRQLDQGDSYRKQIEQDLKARREALAARKAEAEPKAEAKPEPRAEAKAADPADAKPEPRTEGRPAARPCPACSAKNDADAAFCKKCGARFEAAPAVSD